MRIDIVARSRFDSPTSPRRAAGVVMSTPVDGFAVKLRMLGGVESVGSVRFTQIVSPGAGATVACAAAYPYSVARTVWGWPTVQIS